MFPALLKMLKVTSPRPSKICRPQKPLSPPSPRRKFSLMFRNKNLKYLILSRTVISFGTQMMAVVAAWQMFQISHSPFWLGLVGLSQYLPMLILFLITGKVADHFDRRLVIMAAESTFSICALTMALTSLFGVLTKELMLVLVFINGLAYAFQGPSSQALLPNIVKKKMFPQATALMTSLFQFSTIIGPAVGGFIVKFDYYIAYFIITLCALFSVYCIYHINLPKSSSKNSQPTSEESQLKELFLGLKYIKAKPAIFGAISLDMFVVLFGGATALLPIYASDILHIGSVGYGVLRSSQAVGALLMSLVLAKRSIKNHVGLKMFMCVIGFGVMTLIFAVSKTVIISVVALFLLGAFDVVSMVVRSSFVQLNTPDELRGRVSSVNLLFIGTSNQLGEFESGTIATFIGTEPAVVLGGFLAIGITITWMILFPELRKLNSLEV